MGNKFITRIISSDRFKLFLIAILALILRLINLGQSFWLDEAAQVIESARPLREQFNIISDFHPPLFHLILHFWMYFSTSEIWIRLLSVLFSLGSIVLLFKIGCILGKKQDALIAVLILATSPYHIWYSQEARPYMVFLFLALATSYFLISKRWKLYTLTTTLILYTSYFAPFLLLSHIIYVLLFEKKSFRPFIISVGISLGLFIIWLPSFLQQLYLGSNGIFVGWKNIVSVSPLRIIPLTFAKFIFGRGTIKNHTIYSILILPVFFVFLISIFRIYKSKLGKILYILFFIPFVVSAVVSVFIPVAAPQRLIFLLPIFSLILAFGIANLSQKWRMLTISIVLITNLLGIYQYYIDPSTQREQWRQAFSYIESNNGASTIALFVFPEPFAPYLWYNKGIIKAIGIAPRFILSDNDLIFLRAQLSNNSRVYLFQYLTGLTDPYGKSLYFLQDLGYKKSKTVNFPGVGFIYVYDK